MEDQDQHRERSHYEKARTCIERGDLLHAQVHALLYIGVELETANGLGEERTNRIVRSIRQAGNLTIDAEGFLE